MIRKEMIERKRLIIDGLDERVEAFFKYCLEAIKTEEGKKTVSEIKELGIFYAPCDSYACEDLVTLMRDEPEKVPEMWPKIKEERRSEYDFFSDYFRGLLYRTSDYLKAKADLYKAELSLEDEIRYLVILDAEAEGTLEYFDDELE